MTTATAAGASSKDGAPAVPLLSLQHIGKSFGPVQALSDVTFDLHPGEVLALVGDNGAGKSTTIKAISGIGPADSGKMLWEGREVHLKGPKDAGSLGIATMYQDLALADNLDIVQNMFLGREITRSGLLDETSMEKAANKTLADLSVTTVRSIRQPVGSLSGGQRQAVAVARAVLESAKLVIMDEPTAALGVSQTAMVLNLVQTLRDSGVAVLLISHNLVDVFKVADRVAALYLGRIAGVYPIAELDTQRAVELITTGALAGSARNTAGSERN